MRLPFAFCLKTNWTGLLPDAGLRPATRDLKAALSQFNGKAVIASES
jgi:hypothetical protein